MWFWLQSTLELLLRSVLTKLSINYITGRPTEYPQSLHLCHNQLKLARAVGRTLVNETTYRVTILRLYDFDIVLTKYVSSNKSNNYTINNRTHGRLVHNMFERFAFKGYDVTQPTQKTIDYIT